MPRPKKSAATAEYKHVVLGLMFLKYISDSFEEMHSALHEGKGSYAGSDPEDADEYRAENVFWVPRSACGIPGPRTLSCGATASLQRIRFYAVFLAHVVS
jgi:type I restriction-modification system DNA methylase subunit